MSRMAGKQSVMFDRPVEILSHACVAGKKEGEGPLGKKMDVIVEDPKFGKGNWEEGESQFLKTACEIAMRKGGRKKEEVRMAFCGDLLGQMIASSFGIKDLGIPYYGVYGACSSAGAALALAAMAVEGGFADTALAACSSHFGSAEKEFRFPLGYGNQRPYSATWTVTGAGAFLLGSRPETRRREEVQKDGKKEAGRRAKPAKKKKRKVKIRGIVTGKIKDYGTADPFHMGASMAPAAADTIYQALEDFGRVAEDFDCIATGDLGTVGRELLLDLLKKNQVDVRKNHVDCGMEIYSTKEQDAHAGGSGCACSALVLSSLLLPRLESGEWKRILFVPTGALLSQVSANEGRTIPAIAHGIWLEQEGEEECM